jgi:hypothetical protein
MLLECLHLALPEQPPPKISAKTLDSTTQAASAL